MKKGFFEKRAYWINKNKATDMLTKTGINLPAASTYVSLAKNSVSQIDTNVNSKNEKVDLLTIYSKSSPPVSAIYTDTE